MINSSKIKLDGGSYSPWVDRHIIENPIKDHFLFLFLFFLFTFFLLFFPLLLWRVRYLHISCHIRDVPDMWTFSSTLLLLSLHKTAQVQTTFSKQGLTISIIHELKLLRLAIISLRLGSHFKEPRRLFLIFGFVLIFLF